MKTFGIFGWLATVSLAVIGFVGSNAMATTSDGEILSQSTSYFCDESAAHPTLVFRSDLGNAKLIEFQYEDFQGWPPLRRCRELARRSIEFHELGIIGHLTHEVLENGTNVICISKIDMDHLDLRRINPDFVRLLITLRPNDEPQEILDQIRGISSVASLRNGGDPLIH